MALEEPFEFFYSAQALGAFFEMALLMILGRFILVLVLYSPD
jgi:hypothetical protein